MKPLSAFHSALCFGWLLAASATAATLSATVAGTSSSGALNADLTATGGIDWALWNDVSSSTVSSFAPTNWKASDPLGLHSVSITPVSVAGQSSSNFVRGSSLTTATTFSYSDGSSPASASSTSGIVFNGDLNFSNVGIQLQVKGNPTQLLQLDIWAGGFAATGNLTLTLPNATPVTLTSQAYSSTTPKDATLYTVFYQPDSASDLLTIAYTSTNTSTSGHVGIQAVSISAVPEPATGILLIGALGFCGFGRRRMVART
jgi:hypothetical protein